ncbi:MAG TPA: alkyl sulfatase dimerization domain-containing protein [Micromonosporaceae bacterium]|nr:alkyl sulfatase dimerization domain-containing protein [Micromonosporaceae bacterium]
MAPDPDDPTDRANATRGLLDQLTPCVVRDARDRVVWDGERWDFLHGECPDTVHPSLWRQSRLNAVHGLFEVVPGVYQVRGLDISTMTIVEGRTGIVVVDPLTATECATAALDLYRRNRGDRPVAAVVYTHSHADHFGGAGGVINGSDLTGDSVAVVAPDGFLEEAVSEHIVAGPAMLRRAAFMAGTHLPPGPAGTVGLGLAQAAPNGTTGLIRPTMLVTATGQELAYGGARLVFQRTPDTEAPAEMNVYLPDHRVLLVAENAGHTLHNVQTLRGALVRDAHAWAAHLTETIALFGGDAEVLIGSHGWPTWGRAELVRLLSEQRDGYAYLHDQTVRLMNRGLGPTEIAERLAEFPGALGDAWHLRGYYGTLSHNVKAVYHRYMGWFDGNPATLWRLPRADAGRRYIDLAGGTDALVKQAQIAFDGGDLRWAAELLSHLTFAEPDHGGGRELQARTLERLGYGAESATWRNFFLSGAQEMRGPAAATASAGTGNGGLAMMAALSVSQVFRVLATQLDGPRAAATTAVLRWELPDTGEVHTLLLGNGVLTAVPGIAPGGEEPDVTVRLARPVLDLLATRRVTVDAAVADGSARVDGDRAVLVVLFDLLETPRRKFPLAGG